MSAFGLTNYKLGTGTNGGPLSVISVFFAIIGGFARRLTKLLLKAVVVLFYGKSGIFEFTGALLSMRELSTCQSVNGGTFGKVTYSFPPQAC